MSELTLSEGYLEDLFPAPARTRTLAAELRPLASPIMGQVHRRRLQHFVGQDVVGHLELEGAGDELGRMRVAIAFADLAGYTRLTEEAGEEEAVDVVERFVEAVEGTLPEEARVVKTIGEVKLKGFREATDLFPARAP